MFKTILFPIENRDDFRYLINQNELIKHLAGKQIHLVHIVTTEEEVPGANKFLVELINTASIETPGDFTLSHEVGVGHVATEVSKIASEKSMGLIYVRSNRAGLINRMLVGSTASDIVRLADTPILVDKTLPTHNRVESVLYATDFKIAAKKALLYVKALASSTRTVYIEHVGTRAPDPFSEVKRKERTEHDLQLLAQELDRYSKVFTVNSLGRPVTKIEKTIDQYTIDLLIMGRGNQQRMTKAIMGSTATRLISAAKSLVLIIP